MAGEAALERDFHYERVVLTFFDILGFKELVSHRPAPEVGRILSILQQSTALGEVPRAGAVRVISFSDSIVRSRVVAAKPSAALLHEELIDILQAQLSLALDGVFIRGGMSLSDIYMSDSQVFGPALVRSYELESNFATYPRVLIDPDLVAAFAAAEQGGSAGEAFTLLTQRGDDGMYYGHYLGQLAVGYTQAEKDTFLDAHKRAILTSVKALRGGAFSRAKQKYTWLARYHNASCDQLGRTDSEHIIEFEDLDMHQLP